ncbi:MAG: glyoxylate reductase [Thermoleophilaceae bacterium]|nr:glyoxylate reductase [Thermoleophilaceae bacterium]
MEVWPGRLPPAPADLHAACSEAEGLLCLLTDRIDAALLGAAPALRAVSVMAVGVDNVDLAACSARGIQVGHTPGVLTDTTADLAFGLLIAAARRIAEGERDARAGRYEVWDPGGYLGEEVHGATLGIVGMGRIGSAVARRGAGFGMEVIHTGELSLDELLGRADFVSLHVPLRDDTRGLIGERELRLMKPTALLVNTSRGEVVETDALVRALREGWIAAAALDVTDPEPLPAGHPLLDLALVTPHIGSASRRTRELMASMAVDNLLAGLRGERMPHLANP